MDFLEISEVEQHGYKAYHIPQFGQTQTSPFQRAN